MTVGTPLELSTGHSSKPRVRVASSNVLELGVNKTLLVVPCRGCWEDELSDLVRFLTQDLMCLLRDSISSQRYLLVKGPSW
jgi:hypothetical protein